MRGADRCDSSQRLFAAVERQTDRQTDGQTDRQTDRQTD
jgi:hypothetical protein